MPARKYSDTLLNEAAQLREAGLSLAAIGTRLNIHRSAVQYHCLRLGADSPDAACKAPPASPPMEYSRNGHVVRRFTEEEDARLLRLEAEGLGIKEIARRLSRRPNSITARLVTLARHEARREARMAQHQDNELQPAEEDRHG